MIKTDPIQNLAGALQLSMILGLLVNNSLYWHSHLLHTGEVIEHAHPYVPSQDGPFESHSHTESEWWILDIIAHAVFYSEAAPNTPVDSTAIGIEPFYPSPTPSNFTRHFEASHLLRGPTVA
ncbi:MAG: hypothetical protein FJY17_03665 [Bacteroidetes bacterium]|nr:hypothetical protein [Bacteroidota bacterium]